MTPRQLSSSLAMALAVAMFCSCDRKPASPPATSGSGAAGSHTNSPAPDAVYSVRGRITQLPDPKNPMTEFRLRHEAIPTFKSDDGEVIGMGSMEMPFPVADPSVLAGLQVGDLVEITFSDWYKPVREYKVTKVVKLPPGTRLELRGK